MNSDWLAATSYERLHDLISAVNTLSIHAKFILSGRTAPIAEEDAQEVQASRRRLLEFMGRFDTLLQAAAQRGDGTVVGVDPQLGALAMHYLAHQSATRQRSSLYSLPIADLARLFDSKGEKDLQSLVEYLRDLRKFLEQHLSEDITRYGEW